MAYSTSADVIARSALLAGIADAATYIAIADGDIDADLRAIYTVPFTATLPATVVKLSADRAAGLKLRQLYRAGVKDAGLFADLLKDYADDIAALQAGTKTLNAARAGSIPGGDAVSPTWTNQTDDAGDPIAPTFAYPDPDLSTTTLLDIL